MQKYVFKKYKPIYTKYFNQEKEHLQYILGASVEVEHIGSTAVVGLGGKGIIDVLVGVFGEEFQDAKKNLEGSWYTFREIASVPGRLFFRRDCKEKEGVRRVHIHLVIFGSEEWDSPICFRDYLREHTEAVLEYSNIKKKAVEEAGGNGKKYRLLKEGFITKITNEN